MNQEVWSAVDYYITELFIRPDAALNEALQTNEAGGLPSISVSPAQGKFLQLLARAVQAQRILEIGTLGGYSTIWLARALRAGGRLITLEADPKHAKIAQANITRAGLAGIVDLRLGRALDTLPQVADEESGPFDLIFIDADKTSYAEYFAWAVKLSRLGTVIIADNVIRKGAVINPGADDPRVHGVRRFNESVAAEPRVSATAIQTVGAKGYDGFTLAVVTG